MPRGFCPWGFRPALFLSIVFSIDKVFSFLTAFETNLLASVCVGEWSGGAGVICVCQASLTLGCYHVCRSA